MATQPSRRYMTYQEFEDLPRFGRITELLDGEYFVVSPVLRHQLLVGRLHFELQKFLETQPLGILVIAPFDVVLSKELARVIQPDILLMTPASRRKLERGARLLGVPDLAIEILSGSGAYDRAKKLRFYGDYRIPELWHVWPDRPRVEIYRTAESGVFGKVGDVEPDGTLISPLLPGFALAIEALYRDLLDDMSCAES